ncbi:MAG: deoxyguanosinetriphosphate triphosphohydrolase [Dehalococcoidia bacterium]|nr:deoxyguanosinetriphosphate triphosphohydrolase [Dehalococcoidia bacterium]
MVDLNQVRIRLEQREESLSPFAARSARNRGRLRPETPSPLRTDFQRDRDRIIHCKSFRRLKQKTHVFIAPVGDHFVTRLTHTLEVAQIARTIARALNLNEDLTEAIALGHDLGHTPFGHSGEEALAALLPEGFFHNEQSLRVVDLLERGGTGLNLTWEVRDGILHHSKSRAGILAEGDELPATLEGQIVRIADSVAYLNHDVADAIRAGLLTEDDLPERVKEVIGRGHSQRIDALVSDIVASSWAATGLSKGTPVITMSGPMLAAADEMRDFMFERVYLWEASRRETQGAKRIVAFLFEYYTRRPEEIVSDFTLPVDPPARRAADYIAGMTDGFAQELAASLGFVP